MTFLFVVKQKKNVDTFEGVIDALLDGGHTVKLAVQQRDEERDRRLLERFPSPRFELVAPPGRPGRSVAILRAARSGRARSGAVQPSELPRGVEAAAACRGPVPQGARRRGPNRRRCRHRRGPGVATAARGPRAPGARAPERRAPRGVPGAPRPRRGPGHAGCALRIGAERRDQERPGARHPGLDAALQLGQPQLQGGAARRAGPAVRVERAPARSRRRSCTITRRSGWWSWARRGSTSSSRCERQVARRAFLAPLGLDPSAAGAALRVLVAVHRRARAAVRPAVAGGGQVQGPSRCGPATSSCALIRTSCWTRRAPDGDGHVGRPCRGRPAGCSARSTMRGALVLRTTYRHAASLLRVPASRRGRRRASTRARSWRPVSPAVQCSRCLSREPGADGQRNTLHFDYLLRENGGFVSCASDDGGARRRAGRDCRGAARSGGHHALHRRLPAPVRRPAGLTPAGAHARRACHDGAGPVRRHRRRPTHGRMPRPHRCLRRGSSCSCTPQARPRGCT